MIVSEETNEFSDNEGLIEDPNIPTRQKWATKTIHATGELAGNPSDSRRTRSQFESALSVKDPFFTDKCFLIIESDPNTYEESFEYPIWKTNMKENFHFLQNDTWDLVILPPEIKLVQCK